MKAIVCDRCKKVVREDVPYITLAILKHGTPEENVKKDYCEKCYDKIEKHIMAEEF